MWDLQRNPFGNGQAIPFQSNDLARIIGQETDLFDAQINQDLRADAVITQIRQESQRFIGLDGIEPLVLQIISLELIDQADASSFLAHVNDDPRAVFADRFKRGFHLGVAVAAQRMKNVPRQTFRLNAHKDGNGFVDLAHDHGDMDEIIDLRLIGDDGEFTVFGGQFCFHDALNKFFVFTAIFDKTIDGTDPQPMLPGKRDEIRRPGHGPVFIHDLTNDAGRIKSPQPGQIDRGLGMPGADKNAAFKSPQRKQMSWSNKIGWFGFGIDENSDGVGAIRRGDPRCNALGRVHRDRPGRVAFLMPVVEVDLHRMQFQFLKPIVFHGHANKTSGLFGHKIDLLRSDEFGRAQKVTFVLAAFIIHHDDHLAIAEIFQDFFDRIEHEQPF